MNIVAYRKFQFIKDTIVEGKYQEPTQHIEAMFTVAPSSSPQAVPDWVRDTDLFKLALKDGDIEERKL